MSAKESLPIENSRNERDKKFNQGLIVSFGVHIAIASFAILQIVFFNDPVIDISQAVRVDMVGLPDKLKPGEMPQKIEQILKEPAPAEEKPPEEEKPAPEEKAPEKEAPAPPKEKVALPKKEPKVDTEAINLSKTKQKQKQALERLKAQSAIERLKEEMKNEAAPKKSAAPIKGRVISAGTSLTGLDKLQNDNYLQTVESHIKQYWALPQWLKNRPFKARVLVKFDIQGQIISTEVVQSSGEQAYDEACLNAIHKAAPFPKFAEKFSEKYSRDGVIFGFPE